MRLFTVFHVDGESRFLAGQRQLVYLACALRERGHRNVVICRGDSPLRERAAERRLEVRTLPFCCAWDPYTSLKLGLWARSAENPVVHAHTRGAASVAALSSLFGPRVVAATVKGVPADMEECRWAGVAPHELAPPSWDARQALRESFGRAFKADPRAPWIGCLQPAAGADLETLLAAVLILCLERPEARFLIITGEGPERERLSARIEKMGLAGRALPLSPRAAPSALYKCLDAFAAPSGAADADAVLEARACGAPIAAVRSGALPDLVTDGETGLLCRPGDPEALARNIAALLADQKLARTLALNGLKDLARFGLTRMASQMEKIYEAVA